MTIGTSLVLIALGAILKFAVTSRMNGIDISAIGVILMIIGIIGLALGFVMLGSRRTIVPVAGPRVVGRRVERRRIVEEPPAATYVEETEYRDRPY